MAAGRRRDGRKHLTQRPDGRYLIRYKGEYFYGWSEDEAYEKLDEYKAAEKAGELARVNPTVREYSTAWLPRAKVGVMTKTYNGYAREIDRFNGVIGDMKVKEVLPSDIKGIWKLYEGKSESMIRLARMTWAAVFDAAVADGIRRTNPVRDKTAQPHRGTSGSHRAITEEERKLILRVHHKMRTMAMVMLYAGLRRGAALALDIVRDVDFERGVISVREAVTYNDGNVPIIHAGGKTKSAVREIPLLPILRQELAGKTGKLYAKANGETASNTMFIQGWASYMVALEREKNGGYRRWWGKTHEQRERIALGEDIGERQEVRIQPHDLRHSYCTMLRDAGVDMKVAMRWMGHADEKMILKIYDHDEGRIQAEREKLEAFTGEKRRKVYRIRKGIKVRVG